MKQFTTIKVGYSSGIYGCSAEYFTTIWIDDTGINSMHFQGLYGTDDRVANEFKAKGYEQQYTFEEYGKLTRKDMLEPFISEQKAIELVKTRVKA
jgi:hypothetical protein